MWLKRVEPDVAESGQFKSTLLDNNLSPNTAGSVRTFGYETKKGLSKSHLSDDGTVLKHLGVCRCRLQVLTRSTFSSARVVRLILTSLHKS